MQALELDPKDCTTLELFEGHIEYNAICSYLAEECGCDSVVRLGSKGGCGDDYSDPTEENQACSERKFTLGLGSFKVSYNGEEIHFIHAVHGKPAGYSCLKYYTTLVMVVAGLHKKNVLNSFVEVAYEWNNKTDEKLISVYSWDIKDQYWDHCISKRKRNIDSVILPKQLKQKLLNDLDNFLDPSTSSWYAQHGIPYKRSYLLYGPPGTGKTSTIAAIASHVDRHVAYLHV